MKLLIKIRNICLFIVFGIFFSICWLFVEHNYSYIEMIKDLWKLSNQIRLN